MLLLWTSSIAVQPVVEFVTPSIARVRWSHNGDLTDNATGVCVYASGSVKAEVAVRDGVTVMTTDSLVVEIPCDSGAIRFIDRVTGDVLLRESPVAPRSHEAIVREHTVYDENSARIEDTANGKVTVKDIVRRDTIGYRNLYTVRFVTRSTEGLYGLGAHMEDYMNLQGKTLYLTQHNLKAFVPVIVSTRGYGLLFDAGCSMKYSSCPVGDNYEMAMELEAANTLDYYFIKGYCPDKVVAGYRYLTGCVSMMPRYLFGYIQSRERYASSEDIVNTVKEYRQRRVPLDMIVQDWNYWPQGWGYMKMNRDFYPDPKALADSVHSLNAKLMISIWANPQNCPQEQDFRDRGFMLEHSVYDAFNPDARDLYWEYADKEFFSNGFDAWWCDSSEPLDGDWNRMPEPENGRRYSWNAHERRWRLNDEILSETLGAERACLYSLNHARGIYEHQRLATDRKRVVNLTRSTFAGQQRYGTIVWNGDTHASWKSFRQQIPAGLNYMATGNPYWTVDVGCFFTRKDPRWFYIGEFPGGVADDNYKEFYTRMFQWATFLPVLRSHGTDTPREIWQFGEPGTPFYDAIRRMIRMRYTMLPYIYSMAAMQHSGGYTMARPLAFDFPTDSRVYDIKDQYMFGNIMVCPVTSPGAESREVYLPETGTGWIDYYTGQLYQDGTIVTSPSPLNRIPLFVKPGTIIPTCEEKQYSDESPDSLVTVNIYPGSDARFVLYEDEGDNYNYLDGKFSRIAMQWDNGRKELTIEAPEGVFEGMLTRRVFNVVMPDGKSRQVKYQGKRLTVKIK